MKKIIVLLFVVICANFLYAKDDDLFQDGVLEQIEIDRNFEDDFASIESPSGANDASKALISPMHERWDARSVTRYERSASILTAGTDIAHTYHLTVYPQLRFDIWRLFGHVGHPFNFPIYDNGPPSNPPGIRDFGFMSVKKFLVPRTQDFMGWPDVQRIVRHVEVGKPKDPLYLRLSRSHAITLGQGVLVKELVPNGLDDHDYLFTKGHAAFDNFRLDAFLGPTPLAEMAGVNMRFTPLAFRKVHPSIKGLNVDLAYVGDFSAPNLTKTSGNHYQLDADKRLIERAKGTAQAFSFGAAHEYFPIGFLSLTPYLAYGQLFLTGLMTKDQPQKAMVSGGGFHFGHDAKVFFTPGPDGSTLFLRTEGRLFSAGYWPSYFASNYMVDRLIIGENDREINGGGPVSKSQYLAIQAAESWRFGYEFNLAYAFGNFFQASVGYENAIALSNSKDVPALRRVYARTNFSVLDALRFNLGYETSFIKEMKYLFDFDRTRALLSLGGQLQLLPNLYFDAWAKHSFGINDMFAQGDADKSPWLVSMGERRSLSFGLGLEFAMLF